MTAPVAVPAWDQETNDRLIVFPWTILPLALIMPLTSNFWVGLLVPIPTLLVKETTLLLLTLKAVVLF